jgi:hypothetical protein
MPSAPAVTSTRLPASDSSFHMSVVSMSASYPD